MTDPAGRGRTGETLPTFLVIGAQKSGTTTLYRDLLTVPGVCLPHDKEPGNLIDDRVLTDAGRAQYAALYRHALPGQERGDASTAYAKRPEIGGVPRRAREVCGPELRILYLVRNPVRRIVSHHHHRYRRGLAGPDIAREVTADPRYLAYSRYAMQLEPWLQTFGRQRILVLRFESYVAERRATIARICEFLGVEPLVEGISETEVYNPSASERIATGWWRRLRGTALYYRLLRPLLSAGLRHRIRQRLLPPPPPPPPPPDRALVELLIERLADDLARQPEVLGSAAQLWSRQELAAVASA